jgi:hypothetical protein
MAVKRSQDLEAITVRHEQVKNKHIRVRGLNKVERLHAIGGAAHDFEVSLRRQESAQGFAEYGVIIGDDDADLLAVSVLVLLSRLVHGIPSGRKSARKRTKTKI